MVRRRSLIGRAAGTAARTAVIAGTATAVSNKVAARQGVPSAPPAEPQAAPAGLSSEAMEQLKQLAEMRDSGILTDEEFATQKARILS
ncbi:MAG: SHOCT domain-containing protein [Porphyrobacter sp.]|nr:SHOCT domain-containing protein [Porphyrobacter sp.]